MIVHLDQASAVPVFEQLRSQIERLIVAGQLAPGARLPPIRHLAADLGIARGTVNRVYDELARQGLVTSAGRHGTTVQEVEGSGRGIGQHDLASAAESLAVVARQLGLDDSDAHLALDAALRRFVRD